MSDFQAAIPTVLKHEGGYVNDPSDSGGATNFGISLRWLRGQGLLGDFDHDGVVDQNDIRDMTVQEAEDIYEQRWWNVYRYGLFTSQKIATKVFDTAVNIGPTHAHKILQAIIGAAVDGVLGPASYTAANAYVETILLAKYENAQANYYRALVNAKPVLQKYLNGWINRAFDRS